MSESTPQESPVLATSAANGGSGLPTAAEASGLECPAVGAAPPASANTKDIAAAAGAGADAAKALRNEQETATSTDEKANKATQEQTDENATVEQVAGK